MAITAIFAEHVSINASDNAAERWNDLDQLDDVLNTIPANTQVTFWEEWGAPSGIPLGTNERIVMLQSIIAQLQRVRGVDISQDLMGDHLDFPFGENLRDYYQEQQTTHDVRAQGDPVFHLRGFPYGVSLIALLERQRARIGKLLHRVERSPFESWLPILKEAAQTSLLHQYLGQHNFTETLRTFRNILRLRSRNAELRDRALAKEIAKRIRGTDRKHKHVLLRGTFHLRALPPALRSNGIECNVITTEAERSIFAIDYDVAGSPKPDQPHGRKLLISALIEEWCRPRFTDKLHFYQRVTADYEQLAHRLQQIVEDRSITQKSSEIVALLN